MKSLAVYGVGGLGREVLELAYIINDRENKWDHFLFIDDGDVPPVVAGLKVYKYDMAKEHFEDSLEIVMGIGEPVTREKLFQKIQIDGISTPTLIHPDVHIPDTTSIGRGVIIQYGSFISCGVDIKDYVYLQPLCAIGHDCILHEGSIISSFASIAGAVSVGKCTYIGMSAIVKELLTIGDYAVIGMGSAVYKDVSDEMIVIGNPARAVKRNEERQVFHRG